MSDRYKIITTRDGTAVCHQYRGSRNVNANKSEPIKMHLDQTDIMAQVIALKHVEIMNYNHGVSKLVTIVKGR